MVLLDEDKLIEKQYIIKLLNEIKDVFITIQTKWIFIIVLMMIKKIN